MDYWLAFFIFLSFVIDGIITSNSCRLLAQTQTQLLSPVPIFFKGKIAFPPVLHHGNQRLLSNNNNDFVFCCSKTTHPLAFVWEQKCNLGLISLHVLCGINLHSTREIHKETFKRKRIFFSVSRAVVQHVKTSNFFPFAIVCLCISSVRLLNKINSISSSAFRCLVFFALVQSVKYKKK